MNTKLEVIRVNEDVIATSGGIYSGCVMITENPSSPAEADKIKMYYYEEGQSSKSDTMTTYVYEKLKKLNGGDLIQNQWYAYFMDDDYNFTDIKPHSEIGHNYSHIS